LPADNFYSFSHVRHPKGMNLALVRKIFMSLVGHDLTPRLQDESTYETLYTRARQLAADAAKLQHDISGGIRLDDVVIMDDGEASQLRNRLEALKGFCDKICTFNSQAKLRNLPANWTAEGLQTVFDTIPQIEQTRRTLRFVNDFRQRLGYLSQAKQYMVDSQMRQRVDAAMAKIAEVAKVKDDEAQVNTYKAELDALMGEYADWYMAEYNRLHITGLEDNEKRRIQQSNENKICEKVFAADHDKGYFSQAEQYKAWEAKMAQLQMAQSNVTREAVLQTRYTYFPLIFG